MTVNYVLYAFENLDGCSAASILIRWLKFNGHSYKLNFINFKNPEKVFREMCRLHKSLIFILDFPPDRISRFEEKLKLLNLRHNKIIYWNTHHALDEQVQELISTHSSFFDYQPKLCSAEMAYRRFLPDDKISIELKNIAHDLEFWKRKDERSEKLSDLIASNFSMRELVEDLSKGIFWSEKYEKLHDKYLKKKDKAFRDLIKSLKVRYYSPFNFGYAFASTLLSTADAGEKVLNDPKIDVSILLYRDGKISFRRGDHVDLDLTELAKLYNGGGHSYAAGGLFREVMLPIGSGNRFNIAVDKMDKMFREHFKEVR